ncbi:hypothetical protein RS1P1_01030 [Pseudomonas moraviensis]|nr:hypothetical protein RS1P1_01030 [Pseudomonas moraviensis]
MRRQARRQQRRRGQQTATTRDGIDETGKEGNGSQNGQSGEINAEFERHGVGLFGKAQNVSCGEGSHVTCIQLLRRAAGPIREQARSNRCGAVLKINIHRKTIVGVSLLAMAVCQT